MKRILFEKRNNGKFNPDYPLGREMMARRPWWLHGQRTSGNNGRKPAASNRVGAKRRLMDNPGSTQI
ncbi:MAG: hypothetical protein Q7V00_09455 [Sulfurimicrobium sp.]|nr:hypothetical protein [Sulfurimicrobium sp.]MDP1704494.1 hypothetical protein [Sulfurimicrobium sp.]MDP2199416.1 hypothetical protein [Sulfurimicrobium sp.]MDP3686912.1 hypothetical protein [Sulfurimicrobium sp.]